MSPKGVYPHTHIKPREYPDEIVALVRRLYNEEGMTIREIQDELPKGYKAQRIVERYIPTRRSPGKRDQRGPSNHMWRGGDAGYAAAHLRLGPVTGVCVDCSSEARDWSYIGCADEVVDSLGRLYCHHAEHYQPRCKPCHHRYDYKGRRANGQWVSREEVMPHV